MHRPLATPLSYSRSIRPVGDHDHCAQALPKEDSVRTLISIAILAILVLGLGSCASRLLGSNDGPSNAARTSCVGLINIGSCNITQTHNANAGVSSGTLIVIAMIGGGCLLLGCAWPGSRGKQ